MASDPTAPQQVMAAAAQEQLGTLIDSWPTGNFRLAKGKELCHRFEHGLVVGHKRGPLVFPYRDVRVYRELNPSLSRGRDIVIDWTFERDDGQRWTGLASPNAKKNALAMMYEDALAQTCAHQRPAALQTLSEGREVTFGPVRIDRMVLGWSSGSLPWAEITKFSVAPMGDRPTFVAQTARDGAIFKTRDHRVAKVAGIPNFPLLWELVHLAQANAQAAR